MEKTEKFFSTSGPVNPNKHYCLPLSTRLDEKALLLLIKQEKYFILHAPRQTGKTSTMINFARKLNNDGAYTALYVNVEGGQALRGNIEKALPVILQEFATRIKEQLPQQKAFFEIFEDLKKESVPAGSLLTTLLSRWCAQSEKPIVLFIDEIDCLVGDTLISILRQLRSGYDKRPLSFPKSLCLMGVRDVRDYRIWSEAEQQIVLGGPSRSLCEPPQGERLPIKSITNVYDESLVLPDFTFEQTKDLLLQHTHETGQKFTDDAIAYVFEQTQGQPLLTNALAQEACFEMQTNRTMPITKNVIETAKEKLIKHRDTHLNVLIDQLQEPRVRAIIGTIINGISKWSSATGNDFLYVRNLGLIKTDLTGICISNPIYKEIFSRAFSDKFQNSQPCN